MVGLTSCGEQCIVGIMRKFEILAVEMDNSGPGPDRLFRVTYRAIVNKKWIEKTLNIIAVNTAQARERAIARFGDGNEH
jgi:hypothetical protein